MTDDPLVAIIRAVPMVCADCGAHTDESPHCTENQGVHAWETDDAAIAEAVRKYFDKPLWLGKS